MKTLVGFIVFCITLVLMTYILHGAVPVPKAATGTLSVSASETRDFDADKITYSLRILLEDRDKQSLPSKAQKSISELRALLDSLDIPEDSLVAEQYALNKQWNWTGGKQTFSGYQLRQNLTVTLPDPEKSDSFTQSLAAIPEIEITSMATDVQDREEKQKEVLRAATKKAFDKAAFLAKTAGRKLGKPILISDTPVETDGPRIYTNVFASSLGLRGAVQNAPIRKTFSMGSTVSIQFSLK